MQDERDAIVAANRPLPFWQVQRTLSERIEAVFDRETGELYERDDDDWLRTSAWPGLQARRRRAGCRRWRTEELQVQLHWPPRTEFYEDDDTTQRAFDFVDERFILGARAIGAWTRLIPPRVRQLIAPFAELHASLLQWAAGGDRCVDMLAANPALALLATQCRHVGGQRRVRDVHELQVRVEGGATQRQLLAQLDLPASESTRRLLKKVRPESLGFDAVLRLAQVLGDPAASARLRHLPELTRTAIRIGSDPSTLRLVSDAFLRRLVTDERVTRDAIAGPQVEDGECVCFRLSRVAWLNEELGPHTPPRVTSSAGLLRVFRERLGELFARQDDQTEEQPLPPPPFPGTDAIVPLCTARELVAEGRQQRNCAGSMVGEVLDGEVAIYRVLAPERATLSLEPTEQGWGVRDLRGPCNTDVSAPTWDAVEAWLRDAGE